MQISQKCTFKLVLVHNFCLTYTCFPNTILTPIHAQLTFINELEPRTVDIFFGKYVQWTVSVKLTEQIFLGFHLFRPS